MVKLDADWSVVRRAMKRSEEIDEEGPLLGGLYFSAYFSLLGEKSKTNFLAICKLYYKTLRIS